MPATQEQLDALQAAYARGAKRLRLNGEEIEYESMAALRRAISDLKAELSGKSASELTVLTPLAGRGL